MTHRPLEDFIYDKIMVPFNVPGVQLVCSYKGRIILDQAYGYANIKEETAASTNFYHRIASVSKVITRACIDKLVSAGKLSRSSLVFDILNEFSLAENPLCKGITI